MFTDHASLQRQSFARELVAASTPAEQVGAAAGYAIGLLVELSAREDGALAAARIVQATTDICAELIARHATGAHSTTTPSARPATIAHPREQADTQMVSQPTGVHPMSDTKPYRVRLIKRDGSKTWPEDARLDPDLTPSELQRTLIALMRAHTYEDWPERNAKHYALQVLYHSSDEVITTYLGT